MNKKTKILIAVIAVLAIVITTITPWEAFFQEGKDDIATITTAQVNISTNEVKTDTSQVFNVANNENSKDVYIRAKINPIIENKVIDEEGIETWEVFGALEVNNISYNISIDTLSNWVNGGDGYYYYKFVVKPNTMTSNFDINNITLNIPDEIAADIAEFELRTSINFTIEACQAANLGYVANWNLSQLPAGVQVYSE